MPKGTRRTHPSAGQLAFDTAGELGFSNSLRPCGRWKSSVREPGRHSRGRRRPRDCPFRRSAMECATMKWVYGCAVAAALTAVRRKRPSLSMAPAWPNVSRSASWLCARELSAGFRPELRRLSGRVSANSAGIIQDRQGVGPQTAPWTPEPDTLVAGTSPLAEAASNSCGNACAQSARAVLPVVRRRGGAVHGARSAQ